MVTRERGRWRGPARAGRDRKAIVLPKLRPSVVRLDATGSDEEQAENRGAFTRQVSRDRHFIELEGLRGSIQLSARCSHESG